ncbi:hypothetical protein EDC30_11849 [Paucimonas lemoignei]|uniref:Phage integrase family protein n=2 Tax=Paucimonas lemoignei TaxID=29443 RepID=A0A4R3HPI2_PAULE|nr:hypothetical protein EDC30_11849 [Paucimonas lemoignei]
MPLSPNERIRLAEALKKDLIAIHKKEFKGTEGEALIVHALFLAMRTGMNTTPMLELRRDCLKPHPFMPNMMLVESFKRRGNATQLKSLRYSREEHLPISIPMDGVGVLRKVLELTEAVVVEASKNHQKRLWLYRSKKNQDRGVVTVLTMSYMTQGILGLINRHCLHGDDGQPLGLSLSRLRKTLENRLWVLSNGDLFTVAAIMGHTPKIADSNYLVCTNEMRENATLLGEALPEIHRTGNAGDTNGKKVIPLNLQNTPVGSCKDSINGDKAPKNGDHCDNFFSCFSCRSYAIVGSSEDLHRLFSFYWFLDLERDRARTNEWRERFLHTMQLIDAFTVEKFDAAMVASAKEKARIHPIKFWQSYTMGTTESNHATV